MRSIAILAVTIFAGCGSTKTVTEVRTATTTATVTTPAETVTVRTTKKRAKKKPATPDPAVAVQDFFLAMDDDAVALDDAIGLALHGQDVRSEIGHLYSTMLKRTNRWLLDGHDTSIGANLLTSAAAEARGATKSGNQARLVHARRTLQEGRDKLASELVSAK